MVWSSRIVDDLMDGMLYYYYGIVRTRTVQEYRVGNLPAARSHYQHMYYAYVMRMLSVFVLRPAAQQGNKQQLETRVFVRVFFVTGTISFEFSNLIVCRRRVLVCDTTNSLAYSTIN